MDLGTLLKGVLILIFIIFLMFKDAIIFSVRGIKLSSCEKLEKKVKYIDRAMKYLMVYIWGEDWYVALEDKMITWPWQTSMDFLAKTW